MKIYLLIIGFLVGGTITNIINGLYYDGLHNEVGIDHIEQCHNVHSN